MFWPCLKCLRWRTLLDSMAFFLVPFFFPVLFGHMNRDVSFVSSNCTTWLSILFTCHLPFIHVQNIEEFQVRFICKNCFGQFLPAQFLFLSFFFFKNISHLSFAIKLILNLFPVSVSPSSCARPITVTNRKWRKPLSLISTQTISRPPFMHSSTSLLEFSLSYKMDPQQQNNGFGPLTKPRGKTAVITAWFVIVLSGALHVKFAHSSGKKESRDEIHFLPFGSALLILSLVLSEVVRRVCLVTEEIRHKQSRYKGSWKMVFTSTFTFRYGRTVLMVGITSLLI